MSLKEFRGIKKDNDRYRISSIPDYFLFDSNELRKGTVSSRLYSLDNSNEVSECNEPPLEYVGASSELLKERVLVGHSSLWCSKHQDVDYLMDDVRSMIDSILQVPDAVEQLCQLMLSLDDLFNERKFRLARLLIEQLSADIYEDKYLKSMLVVAKEFKEHDQIADVYNSSLAKLKNYRTVY